MSSRPMQGQEDVQLQWSPDVLCYTEKQRTPWRRGGLVQRLYSLEAVTLGDCLGRGTLWFPWVPCSRQSCLPSI